MVHLWIVNISGVRGHSGGEAKDQDTGSKRENCFWTWTCREMRVANDRQWRPPCGCVLFADGGNLVGLVKRKRLPSADACKSVVLRCLCGVHVNLVTIRITDFAAAPATLLHSSRHISYWNPLISANNKRTTCCVDVFSVYVCVPFSDLARYFDFFLPLNLYMLRSIIIIIIARAQRFVLIGAH